jgi:acyl-CoA synthetase (AMP-forming)/AMP-acid ligase II
VRDAAVSCARDSSASTLATLLTGGTVVVPGEVQPLSFWRVASEHGVTWYSAVPTLHQLLLRARPIRRRSPRTERFASSDRAAPRCRRSDACARGRIRRAGARGLRMTEAAHQMASNPLPPRRASRVGRPGTDVQISIMDAAAIICRPASAARSSSRGRT